jgi:hypothetical protein
LLKYFYPVSDLSVNGSKTNIFIREKEEFLRQNPGIIILDGFTPIIPLLADQMEINEEELFLHKYIIDSKEIHKANRLWNK